MRKTVIEDITLLREMKNISFDHPQMILKESKRMTFLHSLTVMTVFTCFLLFITTNIIVTHRDSIRLILLVMMVIGICGCFVR